MAFSHVASHGLAAIFTSWTVYAVVVCGAGNVLLTQTAYQTGRPMVTLPIIAAVTPVASVAIGIGLLGEAPRTGVAGGVAAGFAVLATSLALACLARSVPDTEHRSQGPTDGARDGLAVVPGAASSRYALSIDGLPALPLPLPPAAAEASKVKSGGRHPRRVTTPGRVPAHHRKVSTPGRLALLTPLRRSFPGQRRSNAIERIPAGRR